MIKVKNTKNLTGLTISGTFDDIYDLYTAIENVLEMDFDQGGVTNRILGVCYDLRHCFMGNREVALVENNYHEELEKYHKLLHPQTNVNYEVSILWLEVMFATLALDDFKKRYENDNEFKKMMKKSGMNENQKAYFEKTRHTDLAIVNLFQEKVWSAFMDACGLPAYKRLYKLAKSENITAPSYKYKYYCTQYIDTLEMKYINATPSKREKLLATLTRKMIVCGKDYDEINNMILSYALENSCSVSEVHLTNIDYPETIKW